MIDDLQSTTRTTSEDLDSVFGGAPPPGDDDLNFPYYHQPTILYSKSETIANLKRRPCRIHNLRLLNRRPTTFYVTSTKPARRYQFGVQLGGGINLWRNCYVKGLR